MIDLCICFIFEKERQSETFFSIFVFDFLTGFSICFCGSLFKPESLQNMMLQGLCIFLNVEQQF